MAPSPATAMQGPMLLGTILNVLLYGVFIVQVFTWYTNYKRDLPLIKTLVVMLLFASTLEIGFILVYMYECLIINFYNEAYLMTTTWVFYIIPAFIGVVQALVQSFYAWRVNTLLSGLRRKIAISLICILVAIGLLSTIGTGAATRRVDRFSEFPRIAVPVCMWHGSAFICNSALTGVLLRSLFKPETSSIRPRNILDGLIIFTVQTGLFPVVWAIINLALFVANSNGAYMFFSFSLCNVYTNCMMSNLNERSIWKHELLPVRREDDDEEFTAIVFGPRPALVDDPTIKR
ncbi:hypothetical protein CONPUDRAFT_106514 [Coniophora puteana RWD-64-598 SS2]|uniref:DUF6534 domain-containing protein n=1 Tax=Coniophora puteana (strain RWD-64-598) TaxID=741705 RepID=A0A5M3MM18_CONPW|nr:uncharacterized protein CONPUDRAFT_106514 [Coniophora puteana RWD-64-598 SS2]EIW79814.1 hypothetical protein CONPUDRAFT_106514 [Coniophora puteana RWD-64-598 SS2]